MDKKILITVILLVMVSVVIFNFPHENKSPQQVPHNQNNQIDTKVISIVKPDSFDGIEIVTYKSPYGYEISYPENWAVSDVTDVYYKKDILNAYMFKSQEIADPYVQDQILTIVVEKNTLEGFKKDVDLKKDIRIKDSSDLLPVTINNSNGLYRPFENQESFYYFERNGKLYSLHFHYDPVLNITEQEALWVLSTFKILE